MKIAIDFDGTCVEHSFPSIGKDIGAFRWLKRLQRAGAQLILFTMRSGTHLDAAVKHLESNGITLYGIHADPEQFRWTTSPKAHAELYIDDLAFGCPLVRPPMGRPYVNWRIVGPAVLKKLLQRKQCPRT